ncbi:uncharacterized protein [Diadema setosum]|uniref:uncharacterized protein n=1 Tax=Diadema setosum TaxID=31175 RepID=UPI003B3A5A4C
MYRMQSATQSECSVSEIVYHEEIEEKNLFGVCTGQLANQQRYMESSVVYTAPTVRTWTRGNIRLQCHFEEEPLAVFWVRKSSSNQPLETRKASFFDGNFASKSERFNIDENYSLVISDVHVEDEGRYHCQLVLGSFEVFSNSTLLSVISPAVDTLPTIQGWRGEDIRLPCEFHEEPLAVYWVKESMLNPELSTSKAFYDGDFVSMAARFDIDRNFNLIITDLEVADEGLYHCQVVLRNFENFENSTLMTVSSMALTHEIEECVEETKQDPSRCTHQTPSETSYFNLSCVVSGFRPNISMLWTEESGEKLYSVVSQQKTLADNTYERFETITVSAKLGAEQTFKCTATGDSVNGRSTTEITVLPISGKSVNLGLAIGLGMGISVFLVIAFLLVGKYLQKYHPDYLPRKGCGWNPCWRRQHETELSDAEEELIQTYVHDLMEEVSRWSVNYSASELEKKDAPPFLSSQYTYQAKDELIRQHTSHFCLDT